MFVCLFDCLFVSLNGYNVYIKTEHCFFVLFNSGLLGKVLMEDIRAKEPYPPFAASVKDGYAVIGIVFKYVLK